MTALPQGIAVKHRTGRPVQRSCLSSARHITGTAAFPPEMGMELWRSRHGAYEHRIHPEMRRIRTDGASIKGDGGVPSASVARRPPALETYQPSRG